VEDLLQKHGESNTILPMRVVVHMYLMLLSNARHHNPMFDGAVCIKS
jgi:hypothetical protein